MKPPLGTQINRGHPLARGLVWAMAHNEKAGPARDLISGRGTDVTAPTWGVARDYTATELEMTNAASAPLNFTTGQWTVAVFLNLAAAVGNNQYVQAFERRNYVSESNNQGFDISAFPPNDGVSPDTWNFQVFNNNAAASYRLSASVTPVAGDWWVVGTTDGTTRRLYLNGIERANTTNSPAAASNTTGNLRSYTFGSAGLSRAYLHLAWDRCLSPDHVLRLAVEPYALFVRPRRRVVRGAEAYTFLDPQAAMIWGEAAMVLRWGIGDTTGRTIAARVESVLSYDVLVTVGDDQGEAQMTGAAGVNTEERLVPSVKAPTDTTFYAIVAPS